MSIFLASSLTSRAIRHGQAILAASLSLATVLRSQPASITNTPPAFYLPVVPARADASGNVFYFGTAHGQGNDGPPNKVPKTSTPEPSTLATQASVQGMGKLPVDPV